MLTLHHNPMSCSLASLFALEEASAPFSVVTVDLAAGEQTTAAYLAINPKGRVPALRTERGVLTETPAILTYVAQRFPQAALLPLHDGFEHARVQSFMSYLCSTVHVAHAHRMRGYRWVDAEDTAALQAMQRKVPENMAACFELIEQELLAGPWVLGERYSVADPYLFTVTRWLAADGVDAARFPRVQAHAARMAARPAIARALARQVP
ncbi:MAG: glutathione S-transferase family protein [Betaproteobacteria bacterium]|jgi:glutathione S-transferase|nr:glutathione S-transferase family protein [Rubrivivax sp.]